MSIRQRRSTNQSKETQDNIHDNSVEAEEKKNPSSASMLSGRLLTGTANLANLLPTGTLLAFQILTPVFTNNGACDSVTRLLTLLLLILLSLSCFLASFTDTIKASDGRVYHGIATLKGLWLFDYSEGTLPELSKYKLRLIDFVHALLSVLVFFAVALRDSNVLMCYYPQPRHETKEVLDIVPVGVGFLCSLLFLVFPTTRHGVGYPLATAAPN